MGDGGEGECVRKRVREAETTDPIQKMDQEHMRGKLCLKLDHSIARLLQAISFQTFIQ